MKDRVVKYALAPNARHAKFAARLIPHMKERKELALDVVTVRMSEFLPGDCSLDVVRFRRLQSRCQRLTGSFSSRISQRWLSLPRRRLTRLSRRAM
jgi:hypothetical protein